MAARGHATVDAGVIEQKASIFTLTLRGRVSPQVGQVAVPSSTSALTGILR